MRESAPDPRAAFHAGNVIATEQVARAALDAGVRRFVHASTAKVNGESTLRGRPFCFDDVPNPQDSYARSKWQAEQILDGVVAATPMSAVVLRLPMVYGPGVRGNFRTLWDAVARGQWLPFAAIDNRRSVIGLGNLVDAFEASIDAPAGTYFVADADSVSTPQLVRAIAAAQSVEANLAFVPVALLRVAGAMIGRRAAVERLTSSLEIDNASFRRAANWTPRIALERELVAITEIEGRSPL
jgi:nucleoside-diphosphate-sugar epimerase